LLIILILFANSACSFNEKNVGEENGNFEPNPNGDEDEQSPLPNDPDIVVWAFNPPWGLPYYGEAYVDIWEEPLNKLLKEKDAPYRVKIQPYYSYYVRETGDIIDQETGEIADNNETAVDVLEEYKDQGKQIDVITVPARSITIGEKPNISPYVRTVEKGLLKPLDEYLQSDSLKGINKAVHPRDIERSRVNDFVYGISSILRGVSAISYDQSLLKEKSVDVSQLSADIFENEWLLDEIKSKEGVVPYLLYSGEISGRLGLWGITEYPLIVLGEDGEWICALETEVYKQHYLNILEWKDKGLIRLSIEIENLEDYLVFANGTASRRLEPYSESILEDGSENQRIIIPDINRTTISPESGDCQTGIATWTQNQENALDFLNRLFTDPDIANLIQYGREGQEYTYDGHAHIQSGNPLRGLGEWYTNPLITYSTPEDPPNKRAYIDEYYENCEKEIPDGFRYDPRRSADKILKLQSILNPAVPEMTTDKDARDLVFLNTNDYDKTIESIMEKLREAGIEEVLEDINRQFKEWGGQ
ncbi:MAG: DUF3502 domain-containing protein, partial [Mahellales bacterium]